MKYPVNIHLGYLSKNPSAYDILEKNLKKIDWSQLTNNPNTKEIQLLLKHKDWTKYLIELSSNPSAISLLEQNVEKLSFYNLSRNPCAIHLLFPLDHKTMKQENAAFAEELCAKVFEPKRMQRLAGVMALWDYMDYY